MLLQMKNNKINISFTNSIMSVNIGKRLKMRAPLFSSSINFFSSCEGQDNISIISFWFSWFGIFLFNEVDRFLISSFDSDDFKSKLSCYWKKVINNFERKPITYFTLTITFIFDNPLELFLFLIDHSSVKMCFFVVPLLI